MKRFGILLAGAFLAVATAGCDIEGEAQAGTLEGRQAAAAAEQGATSSGEAPGLGAEAHGGCPYLSHEKADGEPGCGGGYGGGGACGGGDAEAAPACGGGRGAADAFGDDLGGGCAGEYWER